MFKNQSIKNNDLILLNKRLNAKDLNKRLKKYIKSIILANKSNGYMWTSNNKQLDICNFTLIVNGEETKDIIIKDIKKVVSFNIYTTFKCSSDLEYIKNNKKVTIQDFITDATNSIYLSIEKSELLNIYRILNLKVSINLKNDTITVKQYFGDIFNTKIIGGYNPHLFLKHSLESTTSKKQDVNTDIELVFSGTSFNKRFGEDEDVND